MNNHPRNRFAVLLLFGCIHSVGGCVDGKTMHHFPHREVLQLAGASFRGRLG